MDSNLIVSPVSGRRFGRHQPPPLPLHRMITRVSPNLPPVVDLRKWAGAVKDQGDEGSCTAHADCSGFEWINRRYHPEWGILTAAPQFTYVKELQANGNFPNDDGSDGQTACEVAIVSGFCEASLFPYVPGDIVNPTPAQNENAALHRLGAYHGLQGSLVAQSVIGDPTPWPVLIGFDVAESFESDSVAATGIYNPTPGESVVGGHEVLCLGCDLGPVATLRPAGSPPSFLIQNSWGTGWGWEGGYFWMAKSVLDQASTDLKIVHSGGPWN